MAHVRIEMDRGNGWETRSEGDLPTVTQAQAETQMAAVDYSRYAHRILVDGAEIARNRAGRRLARIVDVS